MNPDLFPILNQSAAVRLLLGSNPLRVYPFGRAPEGVRRPYAVYSVYNANPENYLDKVPDIDNKGTQITIYDTVAQKVEGCFAAIRDALEPHAHMTNFSSVQQDADTNDYSCIMEFDFWDKR